MVADQYLHSFALLSSLWQFNFTASDDSAKSKLLASTNQCFTFVTAVKRRVQALSEGVFDQECAGGHQNIELIVQTCFNCFAKNELKCFNAPGYKSQIMTLKN